MLNMSRRDFVVSTALAGALGLNARLVTPAFAQKTPDPAKGFVTYKVGSAEVTALYDGIWEKPHDPAFIANASVDDVKEAMIKAGLPADFRLDPVHGRGREERRQDHPVRLRHRRTGAARPPAR